MPRIYYRNRRIYGEPLKNEKITLEIFAKILANTSFIPEDALHIFSLPQKQSILPWKKDCKSFKYAVVWNHDKPHNTAEYGDFYLPKSIVFFDEKDAYFPSEYFFVVNIDDQLEISHCRAGADTSWYQQPELRREVTDPKLIKRIEKSVTELQQVLGILPKK
ncbi:MAG: hypothetical protein Q4A09_07930 [Capnocytophaga felis]|uniref:Uncharacterized protein n=1 Tax=Capnocytophaga felis TaxID=2267611 RepID=A0A5M4B8K5_9FLAO|nr:hypothetical protein [Capnocytophaga felis]MDO4783128.1 hypothetical protein [Capnocytophaga felis]GET45595.1 hypothetical protein RCZ01_08970 [Capnocytophaga felis]GET47242.1 hypothetical protein RCZ02_00730 [Capnocytophaga felis]